MPAPSTTAEINYEKICRYDLHLTGGTVARVHADSIVKLGDGCVNYFVTPPDGDPILTGTFQEDAILGFTCTTLRDSDTNFFFTDGVKPKAPAGTIRPPIY